MKSLYGIAALGLLAAPAFGQSGVEAPAAGAQRTTALGEIVVTGRRANLVGAAISASEGSVGRQDIDARPLLRSGDLLELVPGLVATQHSGSGKANQYFLRGFNLDHGTDFATSVDGMPVNARTHAHGQGYTDLNFLIPEAVREMTYRKGPYYAEVGDFSSAGSARFHIADRLSDGVAEITAGDGGYARLLLIDSVGLGKGSLLYGIETQTYDGDWSDIDEGVEKINAMLRYSRNAGGGRFHVMAMAYDNRWNSHDQIPRRAVDERIIDAFGSLDPTLGGAGSRYSLSGAWTGPFASGRLETSAYAVASRLNLFSNFTYQLDDPVDGDQFQQVDDRRTYGFEAAQSWTRGRNLWRVGAEGRYDDIGQVGLYRTRARQRLGVVREDAVGEGSLGVFASNAFRFTERLRSTVAVRYDRYGFDVDALSLPANSGDVAAGAASFKASLNWQPLHPLELYASYGQGFHSNDARGTTIRIDPVSGLAARPVDPLVPSEGAELGARVHLGDWFEATAAAWTLRLDSELLFIGDAGATEATRPSRRDGIELGLYGFAGDWLSAEIEAAWTDARFTGIDAAGDHIPGAIPLVISGGVTVRDPSGWLASARLRYFSAYPLIEDDSVESAGSTMVSLRAGKEWGRTGVYLDVFNALDIDDHDIDYFYASRLAGEPAGGVEDIHFNVFQPRQIRLSLRYAL